jgi:hypothetical protein
MKYPWQRLVSECFMARAEDLPHKINAAERAISSRLSQPDIPPLDERIALKGALRALRDLLPDEKRPAHLEVQPDPHRWECPHCGKLNSEDQTACTDCYEPQTRKEPPAENERKSA